ncbi:MAG: helix-turn-helix transcriptional regulator [Muribaculaceae bacterium]|nr:helix-turn-helix transcriptional regulator [Muribaculaceae bacterium]MBR6439429.1 helix-turn-helix transcriptional regulator [Bacteroidales bacterium]
MENEILKSFGAKVRHYRELLGLSQEKFAEKANVHRTYIGTVERGETNITLVNVYKLANALEVNVTQLIKD